MLRRLITMLRKELIQVFRNTLTLRMVLVAPVLQLIVFGYVVILDVNNIPTAVIDHSKSPQSRQLISDFSSSGYFSIIHELENEDQIGLLLDRGEVDLVIIIPRDLAPALAEGKPTSILAAIDGSDSNTAITVGNYFTGIATRFAINSTSGLFEDESQELKIPFEARPRVFFNPQLKTIYFLVPGIIARLSASANWCWERLYRSRCLVM